MWINLKKKYMLNKRNQTKRIQTARFNLHEVINQAKWIHSDRNKKGFGCWSWEESAWKEAQGNFWDEGHILWNIGFEEISWLKWCWYRSLHLQNKILQIVHVRSVHFAVYEFYLSVKKKYLKIIKSLSSWVPRSSRDLRRGTSLSRGTPAAISLSEQYRILPSLLLFPFLPNEVCLWGWLSKAMWCCGKNTDFRKSWNPGFEPLLRDSLAVWLWARKWPPCFCFLFFSLTICRRVRSLLPGVIWKITLAHTSQSVFHTARLSTDAPYTLVFFSSFFYFL